ncbi:hypothetical protein CC80DRAFT_468711 [Byssothecium circinans]|uniref:Septin-type G domain-containing protein n=1 Tax=Byssothecium circinans TaxID=147558 RepID=A0A6A5U1T5_9PLEO|nr:hypothetical protein CC80DRAFT_468711 [Byssothecium circinans]
MRPLSGGDSLPSARPRSRKSSVADASTVASHVPTAFFIKSEGEMEQSLASTKPSEPPSKHHDSTFGVQSLADTLEAAFGPQGSVEHGKGANTGKLAPKPKEKSSRPSTGSPKASRKEADSCKASPTRLLRRKPSNNTVSNPFTPLDVDSRSPAPTSAMPSTPRSISVQSLKLSDEELGLDEVASQALASSEEEEEDTTMEGSSSFPQLVMPSIQMPARRPFTAKGKAMGKLKVLVAGEAGIGKTSLIRSIVQLCDDIVHVDDLSPSSSLAQPTPAPKQKSRKRKLEPSGTTRITEIHASTKSYPSWWTDMEESRVSRRRKSSISDTVLERNICFVDTPGFTSGSKTGDINHVVDYVESQLFQTMSVTTLDDNDLVGVISGSGGISVDVVLYLLPPSHDISDHVEYMQRLSNLTNVIPIIARSDTLSRTEVIAIKTSILVRLQTTSIRPFLFGTAIDDALLAVQGLPGDEPSPASSDHEAVAESKQFPFTFPTYPYAVSSTLGQDTETMDASLLMSPDYVQPLLPSELSILVNRIFDPDSIAWLRHSAAKKFSAWRRRTKLPRDSFILNTLQQQPLKRSSVSCASVGLTGAALNTSAGSSIFSAASPSGVLVPHVGSPFFTSNLQSPFLASSPSLSHTQLDAADQPTDFQLARYKNATHGEQRLAEVRLAKWATDLQRSLRNERERYDELQRSERAKWLLERVGEEVASGNIIATPGGSPRADWAVTRRGGGLDKESCEISAVKRYGRATSGLDSRDPLGLCDFSDQVRRKGFVFVKFLGGASVLGACMLAVVRVVGWEVGVPEGGVWGWLVGTNGE